MYFRTLGCICIISIFPLSSYAAGLEKSGQSIQAFLETGNYAEVSLIKFHSNITGQVSNQDQLAQIGITDFSTGQFIRDSTLIQAGIKWQLNPQISLGMIIDQPFAADIHYNYMPESFVGPVEIEAAKVKIESQNLSTLIGYQPNPYWNIYTGLQIQNFKSDIGVFGQNYYFLNGYEAQFSSNQALGWLAGISYQIPEYYLKFALSYRSAIKHQPLTHEVNASDPYSPNTLSERTTIKTPQSVNFDFQSPISSKNAIYGTIRWVNWHDFHIRPTLFSTILNTYTPYAPELSSTYLLNYNQDQWSAKLGFAHQFNSKWIGIIEGIWDSGTNNPSSSLNPTNGFTSIGLGASYQFNNAVMLSYGVHYAQFKNAKTSTNDSQFSTLPALNNKNAIAYGLKLSRHF